MSFWLPQAGRRTSESAGGDVDRPRSDFSDDRGIKYDGAPAVTQYQQRIMAMLDIFERTPSRKLSEYLPKFCQ
nr:hypothetical protein CFP56_02774 [Quercus suber]